MDFWYQDTTAQRLVKAFRQFRKVDWNKESVAGYKPSEIHVLFVIKKGSKDQNMTVSEISKILQVTSPTVTQIVNSLEANGLVERQTKKEDRRSTHLLLTKKGEEITQQAAEKFSVSINGLIEYLGDKQSGQLIELLNKVFFYYQEVKD